MKKKGLRIFSYLLIIIGIVLLLLPRINHWMIGNRAEKNVEVAIEMPANTLQNNLQSDTSFDFGAVEEISATGTLLSPEYIDPSLIIGRLYVPSIDINVTVFNGVTNDILHAGVGTMRPNLTMGEGNFPIAGHYAHDPSLLFGNLTAIELGDKIFLTDNEKVYEYIVYDTKVVKPSEVEWISEDVATKHGKPIVSLMNCYYVDGVRTNDRFFVFGELAEVHDDIEIMARQ